MPDTSFLIPLMQGLFKERPALPGLLQPGYMVHEGKTIVTFTYYPSGRRTNGIHFSVEVDQATTATQLEDLLYKEFR